MRLPCLRRIYNLRNEHWVLRLLLVSPTHAFLCLVFDPLCNKPYIAGANSEELAIVNLIAERQGIEPRPQKRWDRFLGEFGSVAFAIAPLYSTFLHQEDGVSCHPACLLMLHCLLCGRVVNGSIQLPQDKLWLLREIAQAALHYRDSLHAPAIETTPSWALARMYATPYCPPSRSSCFFLRRHNAHQCALHASGLCPSEICVALRNWRVQFTATLACIVLAFALGDRLVVDKPPSVDEVRPKVVIRGKEFFVLAHLGSLLEKCLFDPFLTQLGTKTAHFQGILGFSMGQNASPCTSSKRAKNTCLSRSRNNFEKNDFFRPGDHGGPTVGPNRARAVLPSGSTK